MLVLLALFMVTVLSVHAQQYEINLDDGEEHKIWALYPDIFLGYNDNMYKSFHMTTTLPGATIKMIVTAFDVEHSSSCYWDYLDVFDGSTTVATPKIGRFCGGGANLDSTPFHDDSNVNVYTPEWESTSNSMLLVFSSDSSVTNEGFEISFQIQLPGVYHKEGYGREKVNFPVVAGEPFTFAPLSFMDTNPSPSGGEYPLSVTVTSAIVKSDFINENITALNGTSPDQFEPTSVAFTVDAETLTLTLTNPSGTNDVLIWLSNAYGYANCVYWTVQAVVVITPDATSELICEDYVGLQKDRAGGSFTCEVHAKSGGVAGFASLDDFNPTIGEASAPGCSIQDYQTSQGYTYDTIFKFNVYLGVFGGEIHVEESTSEDSLSGLFYARSDASGKLECETYAANVGSSVTCTFTPRIAFIEVITFKSIDFHVYQNGSEVTNSTDVPKNAGVDDFGYDFSFDLTDGVVYTVVVPKTAGSSAVSSDWETHVVSYATPDTSSGLSCEYRKVTQGQSMDCYIFMKAGGEPTYADPSAFTISAAGGAVEGLLCEEAVLVDLFYPVLACTYSARGEDGSLATVGDITMTLRVNGAVANTTVVSVVEAPNQANSLVECGVPIILRDSPNPLTCNFTAKDADDEVLETLLMAFSPVVVAGAGAITHFQMESDNPNITIPLTSPDEEGSAYEFEYTPGTQAGNSGIVTVSSGIGGEWRQVDIAVYEEPDDTSSFEEIPEGGGIFVNSTVTLGIAPHVLNKPILTLPSLLKVGIYASYVAGETEVDAMSDLTFGEIESQGVLMSVVNSVGLLLNFSSTFEFTIEAPAQSGQYHAVLWTQRKGAWTASDPVTLNVYNTPDNTSTISCPTTSIQAGIPLVCEITPRNQGQVIYASKEALQNHVSVRADYFSEEHHELADETSMIDVMESVSRESTIDEMWPEVSNKIFVSVTAYVADLVYILSCTSCIEQDIELHATSDDKMFSFTRNGAFAERSALISPSTLGRANDFRTTALPVNAGENFVSISCSPLYCLAATQHGMAMSWGAGPISALGHIEIGNTPTLVNDVDGLFFSQVSVINTDDEDTAGSMGLTSDGKVYFWGPKFPTPILALTYIEGEETLFALSRHQEAYPEAGLVDGPIVRISQKGKFVLVATNQGTVYSWVPFNSQFADFEFGDVNANPFTPVELIHADPSSGECTALIAAPTGTYGIAVFGTDTLYSWGKGLTGTLLPSAYAPFTTTYASLLGAGLDPLDTIQSIDGHAESIHVVTIQGKLLTIFLPFESEVEVLSPYQLEEYFSGSLFASRHHVQVAVGFFDVVVYDDDGAIWHFEQGLEPTRYLDDLWVDYGFSSYDEYSSECFLWCADWSGSYSQCVPEATLCDGLVDCADGFDEDAQLCQVEGQECSGSGEECHFCWDFENRYTPDQRCDGVDDCADGTDEYNCNFCTGAECFTCIAGNQINQTDVCNGLMDCEYGEDEFECGSITSCGANLFLCPNTAECHPCTDWCDGWWDCADGADEDPTYCASEYDAGFGCGGDYGAPSGWTCYEGYYNADDGCDCGCGAPDPDCLINDFIYGCYGGSNPTCSSEGYCEYNSDSYAYNGYNSGYTSYRRRLLSEEVDDTAEGTFLQQQQQNPQQRDGKWLVGKPKPLLDRFMGSAPKLPKRWSHLPASFFTTDAQRALHILPTVPQVDETSTRASAASPRRALLATGVYDASTPLSEYPVEYGDHPSLVSGMEGSDFKLVYANYIIYAVAAPTTIIIDPDTTSPSENCGAVSKTCARLDEALAHTKYFQHDGTTFKLRANVTHHVGYPIASALNDIVIVSEFATRRGANTNVNPVQTVLDCDMSWYNSSEEPGLYSSDMDDEDDVTANTAGCFAMTGTGLFMSGFTIRNACTDSAGGVMATPEQSLTHLRHMHLVNNSASTYGGALAVGDFSTLFLSSCHFEQNEARYGGAVYADQNSFVIAHDSVLTLNIAEEGGALYCSRAVVAFSHSQLTRNNIDYRLRDHEHTDDHDAINVKGGAIKVTLGTLYLGGTIVSENNAQEGGGVNLQSSALIAQDAEFTRNRAEYGAGVFAEFSDAQIDDCVLSNNTAKLYGGAFYCLGNSDVDFIHTSVDANAALKGGGLSAIFCSPHVVGSEFTSNAAESAGGAMWISSKSAVSISDTSFDNNTAGPWSFRQPTETGYGGAVFFDNTETTSEVLNTRFRGNSAHFGGAVYIGGVGVTQFLNYDHADDHAEVMSNATGNATLSSSSALSSSLSSSSLSTVANMTANMTGNGTVSMVAEEEEIFMSEFTNNRARGGAAVFWAESEPIITNETIWLGNRAEYGEKLATGPKSVAFSMWLDEATPQGSAELFRDDMEASVYDHYDQIVKTDSTTQVQLETLTDGAIMFGTTKGVVTRGTVRFGMSDELSNATDVDVPTTYAGVLYQPDTVAAVIGIVRINALTFVTPNRTVVLRQCSPGEYTTHDRCLPCAPGTYSIDGTQDACISCAPGKFQSMSAQQQCEDCPVGRYSVGGVSECAYCERSKKQFQDWTGQAGCKQCPDTFAQSYTVPIESINGTNVTEGDGVVLSYVDCMCDLGYLRTPCDSVLVSERDKAYCDDNTTEWTSSCVECPKGANCNMQGAYIESLEPIPGYFYDAAISNTTFYECPNPDACTGNSKVNGGCLEGHRGNMCQTCDLGYSSCGVLQCCPCPDPVLNNLRLLGFGLLTVLMIAGLTWMTLSAAKNSEQKPKHSMLIKIGTSALQFNSLASVFSYDWPTIVEDFLQTQDEAASVTESFVSVDCFLENDQGISAFWIKTMLLFLSPFFLGGLCFVFFFLRGLLCNFDTPGHDLYVDFQTKRATAKEGCLAQPCCKRKTYLESRQDPSSPYFGMTVDNAQHAFIERMSNEFVSAVVVMFFVIHPNIVKACFMSISCVDLAPGTSVGGDEYLFLSQDMTFRCYTEEHWVWITCLFIPMFFAEVIGIPAFAFYLLWPHRHTFNQLSVHEEAENLEKETKHIARKKTKLLTGKDASAVIETTSKALEKEEDGSESDKDGDEISEEEVKKHSQESRKVHRDIFTKYGFLFDGYEARFWYWETVVLFRKVALVGIAVYWAQRPDIQTLMAILLVFFALMAQMKFEPFSIQDVDNMESLSLFVACMTFILGQFLWAFQARSFSSIFTSIVIVALNVGFYAWLFYSTWKALWDVKGKMLKEQMDAIQGGLKAKAESVMSPALGRVMSSAKLDLLRPNSPSPNTKNNDKKTQKKPSPITAKKYISEPETALPGVVDDDDAAIIPEQAETTVTVHQEPESVFNSPIIEAETVFAFDTNTVDETVVDEVKRQSHSVAHDEPKAADGEEDLDNLIREFESIETNQDEEEKEEKKI